MEIGLVQQVDIDQEMQQSYLDYAMSVIVARALPDVRDGLKPVQRRILYSMHTMGLYPGSAYKKSARIVGEVLGKYHPHGDMAVYESMARLAQPFTMRYCQVDGQGNFGSVDGDPPAAMRYTEARLTDYAMELLADLDKDTVGFTGNFDSSLSEPDVLPSAIPNLLVNGASGIAVGMATNIPPHHLGEVIDALVFMSQKWEKLDDIPVSDLMNYIKGPDFPTGGIILEESEQESLLTAYATGRGRILVRGRVDIEEASRGRNRLVVTELPYLTNKSSLIERIATLAREGIVEGISDLRDESDRHGMRIVIELKQGTVPESILKDLLQRTPLQTTFGINMLALVNGEPRLLTLKQALRAYLEHRQIVIKRRSEYELQRAKERIHILQGLRIAISYLEEIIKLIKGSSDAEQAKARLMKKYHLSSIQSQAILDMPLKRLAAMERKKLEEEFKSLSTRIKELESMLKSQKKIRQEVENELLIVKTRFNDRRRTQLRTLKGEETTSDRLTTTDLIEAKQVWIAINQDERISMSSDEDLPKLNLKKPSRFLIHSDTLQILYLVKKDGEAGSIAVHSLPDVVQFPEGIQIDKFIQFTKPGKICAAFSTPVRKESRPVEFVTTVTAEGMVKKSVLEELPGPGANSFLLARINEGDELRFAFLSSDEDQILLVSQQGYGIRFDSKEVRPMGLVAAGVNGMKLIQEKSVVWASTVRGAEEILIAVNDGMGFRLSVSDFPIQGRYGQGVIACKLEEGRQVVGCLVNLQTPLGLIERSSGPFRRIRYDDVGLGKRPYKGFLLADLKEGQKIIAITPIQAVMQLRRHTSGKSTRKKRKRQTKSAVP
jgi:DNA gyrase subunit A